MHQVLDNKDEYILAVNLSSTEDLKKIQLQNSNRIISIKHVNSGGMFHGDEEKTTLIYSKSDGWVVDMSSPKDTIKLFNYMALRNELKNNIDLQRLFNVTNDAIEDISFYFFPQWFFFKIFRV